MAKLSAKIFNEEMGREKFIDDRLRDAMGKLSLSMDQMISVKDYVATAKEQLELLKHECKFELKRVMKQGF